MKGSEKKSAKEIKNKRSSPNKKRDMSTPTRRKTSSEEVLSPYLKHEEVKEEHEDTPTPTKKHQSTPEESGIVNKEEKSDNPRMLRHTRKFRGSPFVLTGGDDVVAPVWMNRDDLVVVLNTLCESVSRSVPSFKRESMLEAILSLQLSDSLPVCI